MKWFKFEPHEEEISETESSSILVYLTPEALKHAVIVDDFASFQDSPECIPGGRLFEVSRQYSYRLRQVADLVEEPLDDKKLQLKDQSKRNFHDEIHPEKRLENGNESVGDIQTHQKLRPEQVPFKDLESLFVK